MKQKHANGFNILQIKGHTAVAINSFEGKGLQSVTKAAQEILAAKMGTYEITRNETTSHSCDDCWNSKRR